MGFSQLSLTDGARAGLQGFFYLPDEALAGAPFAAEKHRLQRLIVLLHGWGADARDLAPLAPALAGGNSSCAVFVPDAPEPCSANPAGRQWFELASPDLGTAVIAEACLAAAPILHQLLDDLQARFSLSAAQIVLGGFSQGGMISLSGGLGYGPALGGLFCLSGGWLTPEQTVCQPSALPVFLAHGGTDPVVDVNLMKQTSAALAARGLCARTLLRPALAHSIDDEMLKGLAEFLQASA